MPMLICPSRGVSKKLEWIDIGHRSVWSFQPCFKKDAAHVGERLFAVLLTWVLAGVQGWQFTACGVESLRSGKVI